MKIDIRKMKKQFFVYFILFISMIVIFCLGMIISYVLPNNRIQAHISEDENVLLRESGNLFFGEYIESAKLDDYTDLVIMNIAMNKGKTENESVFVRAFENSLYSEDKMTQYDIMEKTLNDKDLYNNQEYARYWHGIQTVVRPLLLFLNYEEIRYLFMLIMFILFIIAILMIYKNLSVWHALSFAFSMLAINFFIIPMSLQYTSVFAIMLVTVILVNYIYQKKKEKLLPYLFFIVGGCTTFMDLLTAPLVTLGIPLIIVTLLRNKEKSNIKDTIIQIIKFSILWTISYGVVFVAKWIIASIVLKQNIIIQAINQIIFRTNGSEEYPATPIGAILKNLKVLYNTVFLASGIIIGIIWFINLIKRRNIKGIKGSIPLLLISIYPYVWYAVIAGHSTIHAFFTYRIQVITIFGFLCAMLECTSLSKEKCKRIDSKHYRKDI